MGLKYAMSNRKCRNCAHYESEHLKDKTGCRVTGCACWGFEAVK